MTGYLRGEVSVYMTLTTHAMMAGQTDSGLEFSERYLRIADQLGDPWLRMCAVNDKAMLLVAANRYEDALAMAPDAIRAAQSINSVFFEFGARIVFAEALLGLGRTAEALRSLEETLKLHVEAWPLFTSRAWRCLAATHAALGNEKEGRRAEAQAAAWAAKAGKGGMLREFLEPTAPSGNTQTPSAPPRAAALRVRRVGRPRRPA